MWWPFKLHRDQAAAERMRQSRDYWKTRALTAERQRDTAWALTSHQNRVVQEQGAELAKLREELAAVKAELLACRTGLCDWSNDLRSQLNASKSELARERRLRDLHAATCPTAEAIQDHVDDKNRENAL